MKRKFNLVRVIMLCLIITQMVSAQNPQQNNHRKSFEDYENLFAKAVLDPVMKVKMKSSSVMTIDKLAKELKLSKIQQDSLEVRFNNMLLRLQFAETFENKEDQKDYKLSSELIYTNYFDAIITEDQKLTFKEMLKRKSEEKKFPSYLEDHKDEYKPLKSE